MMFIPPQETPKQDDSKLNAEDKLALSLAEMPYMSLEYRSKVAELGQRADQLRERGKALKAEIENQKRLQKNHELGMAELNRLSQADIEVDRIRTAPIEDAIRKHGVELTKYDLQKIAVDQGLRTEHKLFQDWMKGCKQTMGVHYLNPARNKVSDKTLRDL
ncbi:hypothetical protein [Thalassotalea sp. Y01]|uniref:hypothetical protein n=1 Tax=Thalassotalea sp. Y01 TaxID=2729613 RepID=UPI00145E6A1D|nr:hypothetical protein [Thalassotalea sp. Y01]NMP17513.1 hypothetical protein [Thalassotalea sp. Y01]